MNAESKTPKSPAKSRKAAKPADATTLTLKELAAQYLRELERQGRSAGTVFSYGMELQLAMAELGSATQVASITPERVREFNESDAVTKTRKGRPKAKLTQDKTRRVLRMAIAWAQEQGLISDVSAPSKNVPTTTARRAKAVATTQEEQVSRPASTTESSA